jgi:hypothetical protein
MLASGKFLEYVQSPNCHSIVLYHDAKAKEIYPVFITKGCYLSNGRVSNFWNWCRLNEDLSLGEEECGYGNFYTPIQKFDVKVLFKIERISV